VIGPRTLRAARGANDRATIITRACDLRLAVLRGLETWPDFGHGWSRRVREVRAAALAMAGAA
jgi:lysozyme family protein